MGTRPTVSRLFALTALGVGLLGLGSARADITYNFNGNLAGCPITGTTSGTNGNTCVVTSGGTTVTAQAWSNTGGNQSTTNSSGGTLQTGYLGTYSGGVLGVTNRDSGANPGAGSADAGDTSETISPEHAIDNNQRYDSVLLTFTNASSTPTKVDLKNLTIGFPDNSSNAPDADMTVLAWSGAAAPTLTGNTYSQLIGLGWRLVNNYSNVDQNGQTQNLTLTGNANAAQYWQAGNTSAYWLIMALNPCAQPGANTTTCVGSAVGNLTDTDDAFKLKTVTSYATVPEPGSLALVGITLIASGFLRRRVSRK